MRLLATAAAGVLWASAALAGLDSSAKRYAELEGVLEQAGADVRAASIGAALTEEFFRKLDPQAKVLTKDEVAAVKRAGDTPARIDTWPLGILYVRLSSVEDGAGKALAAALGSGTNEAVTGIVLDLRGADGRNAEESERLAGLFLPEGTPLCRLLSGEGVHSRTLSAGGGGEPLVTATTVILIDGNTGGLAEMLAGALSGRPNILVLGRNSSGLSAVRRFVPFGEDRHVLIATGWADWGIGVKKPVEPDFVLGEPLSDSPVPEPKRAGRQSTELTRLLTATAQDRAARLATDFILSQLRLDKRTESDSEITED